MATTQADPTTLLTVERSLKASPERVFEAWTNEAMLRKWHAPGDYTVVFAEADVTVGGRYRITMRARKKGVSNTVTGEYREIVPNERLVYTWEWERDHDQVGETLVTVTFAKDGDKTLLRIVHERFPDGQARDKHGEGWNGTLDNLGEVVHLYQNVKCCGSDGLTGPVVNAQIAVTYYLQQICFTEMVRCEHILPGVTDEDSLWQPGPGRPPIAWHVAHIAFSEASCILGMCKGDWDAIPPSWMERYRMGATLPEDVTSLPPLSEIHQEATRLRRESEAHLRTLTEEALHATMPQRRVDLVPEFMFTPMDALRSLPIHEAHHNGEMALIKKLLEQRVEAGAAH